MSNSTDRRSLPRSRLSAVAAARRSKGVGIGLLAVVGTLVLGGEARGQVGVESDREVLEAFYHATGGPDWFFSTNWLSDEPLSAWYGVTTNEEGRVVQLVLQNNNLSGSIPPELARLTNLFNLSLFRNRLSGPIPPELGRLTGLGNLQLAWNELSGPIPPELGQLTDLTNLMLLDNQLSGPIPPELGRLTSLRYLQLFQNELSGPIPPELSQLTNLELLGLDGNQLTGPIPPELGRLTALRNQLGLGGNQLTGPIPPELGQLIDLEVLTLFANELSGPIPPELGRLTRLRTLQIGRNQLSGPIPVELGNLTALTNLLIDSDTGLCLPPELQDTVFGQLALDEDVPMCAAVTALPPATSWVLALALVVLGLHRLANGSRVGREIPIRAME